VSKLLSRKVLVPTLIVIVALVILNLLPIPRMVLPVISIAAEPVFDLFGFTITNSLLASWLTMLFLIVSAWAIMRKKKEIPGRWQGALEMIIEGFYGLVERAAGPKWTPKFFPIVMTIFLFVIAANWFGLTPLYGSWGPLHHSEHGYEVEWNNSHTLGILKEPDASHEEGETGTHGGEGERYEVIALFRPPTTDLNMTFALAIISVILTQYFGVKALGVGYFGKFIAVGGFVKALTGKGLGCMGRIAAFGMGIIDFAIGLVEAISEIGKVVSFSFRLFGNIFAGEVLIGVMAFLIPYLVSLPFYGLEIFVGFVQALVFMMLSVAFFVVATAEHGGEH
jgi:F-type H+-transporting ATPase subunit a